MILTLKRMIQRSLISLTNWWNKEWPRQWCEALNGDLFSTNAAVVRATCLPLAAAMFPPCVADRFWLLLGDANPILDPLAAALTWDAAVKPVPTIRTDRGQQHDVVMNQHINSCILALQAVHASTQARTSLWVPLVLPPELYASGPMCRWWTALAYSRRAARVLSTLRSVEPRTTDYIVPHRLLKCKSHTFRQGLDDEDAATIHKALVDALESYSIAWALEAEAVEWNELSIDQVVQASRHLATQPPEVDVVFWGNVATCGALPICPRLPSLPDVPRADG